MAYWEFLLQKEGDRDWLPLETAHVEILEGRYRIMAHTSHRETPVQVQLTQRLDTSPSKPRRLTRQGRTNPEGLMAVMPFTQLTAGRWNISCQGTEGEAWAYGVELRVLPVTADPEDWAPDWDLPDLAQALPNMPGLASLRGTAMAAAHGTDPDAPLAMPAESSQSVESTPSLASGPPAEAAVATPSAGATAETPPPSTAAPPPIDGATLTELPLRLRLQQQAIVARQGIPIILAGQVETATEMSLAADPWADLWVQLRDPETGHLVGTCGRSLPLSTDPTPFTLTIPLPTGLNTRLLLGEMALWQGNPLQLQAIQGFTITVNLDTLLEVVANQGEHTSLDPFEAVPPTAEAAPEPAAKPAKPLQAPQPREVPFQLIYLPTTGFTLPPQIHRPSPGAVTPLDLPALPNQPRRTPKPAADTPPPRPLTLPPLKPQSFPPTAPADSGPGEIAVPPRPGVALPPLGRSHLTPEGTADEPPSTDLPSAGEGDEADAILPGLPQDETFQSLKLQDRFWSRLSALAQEGHDTAAHLKQEMQAAGLETDGQAVPEANLAEPVAPTPVVVDLPGDRHEVVVYDDAEPLSTTPEALMAVPPSGALAAAEEDIPPVPLPHLELPPGDLVAGTPMTVGVRLPRSPRRLAVKFWMTDIQSRTLLEKPRWLMNWSPTTTDRQEALLQLQVPLGCLEARFEAIAIDLTNQQESHKVSQTRTIIPPNLVGQYGDDDLT